MVSRKISRRSASGSAIRTFVACSTSSSPSGYFFSTSALSCASRRSASCTRAGSPEIRKTFPRCPMWTESRRSIRRRFSLLPPARALAPSLSVSSSRAEGSAMEGRYLIEGRQQDKPLWGPPVLVGIPERIAHVAGRDELSVDKRRQGPRVLAVFDPIHLERALQAEDLVLGEEPEHGASPRGPLAASRSQGRNGEVDEEDGGAEGRRRHGQSDERPASRRLACGGDRFGLAGGADRLQVAPVAKLDECLPGLELARAGDVSNVARGATFDGEPVDLAVPLAGFAVPLARIRHRVGEVLLLRERRVGPGELLADGGPLVHAAEALEENGLRPHRLESALESLQLLLLELVGAALPGEEFVERLRGLQPHDLGEGVGGEIVVLEEHVAEALEGPPLHDERLFELLLGEDLGAKEHVAEERLLRPGVVGGEDDVPFDEEHIDFLGPVLEDELPRLRLMADELQDVGDAEILEGPGESHLGALLPGARGDVAEAEPVGEKERRDGEADAEHRDAAPDRIRRMCETVEQHHARHQAPRQEQEQKAPDGIPEKDVPCAGEDVRELHEDRLPAVVALDRGLLARPLRWIDPRPAHENVHALGAERFARPGIRVAAPADLAAAAIAAAARPDPAAGNVEQEDEERDGDGEDLRKPAAEQDPQLFGDRDGGIGVAGDEGIERRRIEGDVHGELVRLARSQLTRGEGVDCPPVEL